MTHIYTAWWVRLLYTRQFSGCTNIWCPITKTVHLYKCHHLIWYAIKIAYCKSQVKAMDNLVCKVLQRLYIKPFKRHVVRQYILNIYFEKEKFWLEEIYRGRTFRYKYSMNEWHMEYKGRLTSQRSVKWWHMCALASQISGNPMFIHFLVSVKKTQKNKTSASDLESVYMSSLHHEYRIDSEYPF